MPISLCNIDLDDVEITELDDVDNQAALDQSRPTVSFSESTFGPYLTVTAMRPTGHCGFRAIAHAIFKCQDEWNDIRTSLLNHLESYGEEDANPYVLAAGARFGELKDSLECRAAEGAIRSQWFHDTWHGQLVTDRYNIFLVSAEKVGGTKVLIWAPTRYTSVNAVDRKSVV